MGTAAGTHVFVHYGWRAAAGLNLGWYGLQILFLLLRGPHCSRHTWFGYEGGIEARKSVIDEKKRMKEGCSVTGGNDLEAGEKSRISIGLQQDSGGVSPSVRESSDTGNLLRKD